MKRRQTNGSRDPEWRSRLTAYIREKGGLVTRTRMAVAEVFFDMEGHPGIEELIARVHRRHPGIGEATVYRTMRLLVEAGLVVPREFGEGFTRYEAIAELGHHNHLVCTRCGTIIEFTDPAVDAIHRTVTDRHGFVVRDHRLEIYGLCRACRDADAPEIRPRRGRGGSRPRRAS
jgi:Fur family ferric uptake transcriptional regulator